MMAERNLAHEVQYAAALSTLDAVPRLIEGRLVV
jgi:phosphosulfolactate phosphohydrolase-like enzyme